MDYLQIQGFLQNNGPELIIWKKNPPAANYLDGIWVCQIHLARGILVSLLKTHGQNLDEESLQTRIGKIVNDINSRTLTVKLIKGFNPSSPNNLLTTKSKVMVPLHGVFQIPVLIAYRDGEGFNI